MNILLIEILACLIAAALLSLFIGWIIRSAKSKKEVQAADVAWETKISELQLRHKQTTEHLEEQVDRLDSESNQLARRNESITVSLKKYELSINQARTDAIELNRKQANTQERLQRIIVQKDEELKIYKENTAKLKDRHVQQARAAKTASRATVISTDSTKAKIASLSAKRVAWEADRQRLIKSMGDDQETIAIDPADRPIDPLDKTVRINKQQALNLKKRLSKEREPDDAESDKTQMIDDDQTIALDDHNMNGSRSKKPNNKNPKPSNNDN